MNWESYLVQRKKKKSGQTQRPPRKWGGVIIDSLSPGYKTKQTVGQPAGRIVGSLAKPRGGGGAYSGMTYPQIGQQINRDVRDRKREIENFPW